MALDRDDPQIRPASSGIPRGRLTLQCRRRVEDLWAFRDDPDGASADLQRHVAVCRHCSDYLRRIDILTHATQALKAEPVHSDDTLFTRVMSVVHSEIRSGPDLPLLPEPLKATISTAAVTATIRLAVSALSDVVVGRIKVTAVSPIGVQVHLAARVLLLRLADEDEARQRIVDVISGAVMSEIGLPVLDVALDVTPAVRPELPSESPAEVGT